jgi:hypothetical protein
MGRPPLSIDVPKKDQQELRALLKGGVQQVRVVLRALALLQLAEKSSAPQIAKVIPLTSQAIRRVGHRYEQAGLQGALYEKHRPGAAEVLDASQKTADHRPGMQQPARGARPLDGPAGCRRGCEAQTGSNSRKRGNPHSAAPPRPQAVAGKKCGASRTSMKSMSPRWRTCWKYMNGRMIRTNR